MADDEESAEQSELPQLVVQQFSMEALHHIMNRFDGKQLPNPRHV